MNAKKNGATVRAVNPTQQPGRSAKQDHFTSFPIEIQAIPTDGDALTKYLCEIGKRLIMISNRIINCHTQEKVSP